MIFPRIKKYSKYEKDYYDAAIKSLSIYRQKVYNNLRVWNQTIFAYYSGFNMV